MGLKIISDKLTEALRPLEFTQPVSHVYNPLEYARRAYDIYIERYGTGSKEILLLGMNPGPWGMAQTGIPFGEIDFVRNWLKINAPVGRPANVHPKNRSTGSTAPAVKSVGAACGAGHENGLKALNIFLNVFLWPTTARFYLSRPADATGPPTPSE